MILTKRSNSIAPVKADLLLSIESRRSVMLPVASEGSNSAGEVSRLFNAALVDRKFCHLLLAEPEVALAQGYNNETFHLALEDRHFVLATRAASLADLAAGWLRFHQGR
jgi:hypothetical protein